MRQISALDPVARARLAGWMSQFTAVVGQTPMVAARTLHAQATQPVGVEAASGVWLHNVELAFAMPALDDRDELVYDALVAAAKVILRNVPESGDRSSALRDLRVARWKAHSAIANHGRF
jgi:hypothetical protein